MTVGIVVPVLGRPQSVQPTIDTVEAATREPFMLMFVATDTDEPEIAALQASGAAYMTIDEPGTYARKINLGANTLLPFCEWILMAADDLKYHDGWYEAAMAVHRATGAVVIGTNDLGNPRTKGGGHSTHTLVHRSYIEDPGGVWDEGPGSLLHEGYPHEYVDDEFVQTAMTRQVYAHSFDSHIEHLHYLWGKGQDDDTYRLGRRHTQTGRALYLRRRRMWANQVWTQ